MICEMDRRGRMPRRFELLVAEPYSCPVGVHQFGRVESRVMLSVGSLKRHRMAHAGWDVNNPSQNVEGV